ncbi:hypothetical protein [Tahibacter caeni]|uniref:hypothetical protein n=1 Tax=Tahibacter caeni TaxID=1453545 RepID=UPI002148540B|nr:hypothetical protein [Tahibacter caeni]
MFLANSRYSNVAVVETTTSTGERVTALKLRRLTPVAGTPHVVEEGDRLDLYAHAAGDATQFWHVADANTALDGRTLVATPGGTLDLPER